MSFISYENGQTLFGKVGNAIKGQEGLLSDTVGWSGKNLLAIPASVVTTTINDVAFTVNRNANGEVTSIVANGTASNDAVLRIAPHTVNAPTYAEELPIARGNYKYSCLSSAGSDSTYFSTVIARTSSEASRGVIGTDRGSGATFTVSNDTTRIEFNITIKKNQQVSNVAFYPMLMDARISDSTYEPHHESVDACKADNSVIAPVESGSTASQAYAIGEHFVKDKRFCTAVAAIAIGDTLTAGTNYNARSVGADINYQIHATTRGGYGMQITSGNLNDIKTFGLVFWSTSDAANISNLPTGLNASAACYITETYPGYLRQTIIMREADTIYTRRWNGSAWSNWVKIEPTSV